MKERKVRFLSHADVSTLRASSRNIWSIERRRVFLLAVAKQAEREPAKDWLILARTKG